MSHYFQHLQCLGDMLCSFTQTDRAEQPMKAVQLQTSRCRWLCRLCSFYKSLIGMDFVLSLLMKEKCLN